MRTKNLAGLLMSLLVLVMAGCGGGGGGGGTTLLPSAGRTVAGTASKGPIAGGTVKVYEIISSATLNPRANIPRYSSTALGQATTAADGSYSVTIPGGLTRGSVMVQITGGSYTDESTGGSRNLDDQYGPNGMRAVFDNISGLVKRGEQLNVSVTPYTELAVREAGENPTDDKVHSSNGKIAAAFNLPDITRTKPYDPNKAFPLLGNDDSKKYALALATLSQYQKDYGAGASMSQIAAALGTELSGGNLTPETTGKLGASSNNYAGGSKNLNPELSGSADNPYAPKNIHISPASPVSTSIGSSVTISAHVVKSDDTAVPDGTVINFSSNFGTLSAASALTVNGFATVTLASATAVGTAQVTASYGTLLGSAAAISFVDPNAPASITLSASASQGVTTGAPVVISANVVRAAGGPVPDNTAVSFTITSGSGTLSGATTTSGGIATVNLSSSVAAASVTVKASAGAVNQSVSVPFISQPTQAIVKVATTGALSGALIGGIDATVNYASGKGLSIVPAGVAVSGVATGSTLIPNTNNSGRVVLGLLNVGGIPLGEFATLTFSIAAGNFPTSADFSIAAGANAIDVTTAPIAGVGAGILSVTIQ